jgi:hypothetical protein
MEKTESVKLTTLTTKGGFGCKIGPADLAEVLRSLPLATPNPNSGNHTADLQIVDIEVENVEDAFQKVLQTISRMKLLPLS